jgi:ABC-type transport system involved in cytochrome c biogenesis permease subunit
MLYIHPPIAIAGYVLIFVYTLLLFRDPGKRFRLEFFGAAAWLFTLLGLATGMLWAQMAWGTYWSWDPKETMTLALFLSISGSLLAYYEKRPGPAKALACASCVLSILTASTSWIIAGLHSFA